MRTRRKKTGYRVCVVGKIRECHDFKSAKSAKSFARIGSQRGRPRVVLKGRRRIRKYVRGKRI